MVTNRVIDAESNLPTFMTPQTFGSLKTAWDKLAANKLGGPIGPSYIFVPWAGEQLAATGRGIYYAGIATNAAAAGDREPNFEDSLRGTEDYCRHPPGHSSFWQFLNALTRELFGGPYNTTQARWGWSNLLKIAGTKGEPGTWPRNLIAGQLEACVAALREEIAKLRQSLIVVVSNDDYGILHHVVGPKELWDTQPRSSRLHFRHDSVSENTFVHCDHPKYMRLSGSFDAAITDTVRLAQETLPAFSA